MLKISHLPIAFSLISLFAIAFQLPSYGQNLSGNTQLPLNPAQQSAVNAAAITLLKTLAGGTEIDRITLALVSGDTDLTILAPESLAKLKTEVLFAINEAIRLDSSDTLLSSTIPTKNGVANLSTFYDAPKKEVTISLAGGKIANALIVSPTNQSDGSVKIGTKQPILIPKDTKNTQAAIITAIAVLASGGSANQAVVAAQISGTGADVDTTMKLITKLSGLISKSTGAELAIAPDRLSEAINTYNAVLDTSSPKIVTELSKNQAFIKIGETLRNLRSAIGN
jgi:hypothetical protein